MKRFILLTLVLACDLHDLETSQDSIEVMRCSRIAAHADSPGSPWDQDLYYRCIHGHAQPTDAGADAWSVYQ